MRRSRMTIRSRQAAPAAASGLQLHPNRRCGYPVLASQAGPTEASAHYSLGAPPQRGRDLGTRAGSVNSAEGLGSALRLLHRDHWRPTGGLECLLEGGLVSLAIRRGHLAGEIG